MTVHVNVELTETQKAQLDALALHEAVQPEVLIADIVQQHLDEDARYRAAVEEGLAAVRRGEVFSHEEVVARAKLRAQRLLEHRAEKWGPVFRKNGAKTKN